MLSSVRSAATMADIDQANPIHVEIMAERASAYFNTTRKMLSAVSAFCEFNEKYKGAACDAVVNRQRADLLAEAAEQVWFFMIQREAMRLPYYDELFADFGIPDEIRKRMGPRSLKGTEQRSL
jgi:hypothetical protein